MKLYYKPGACSLSSRIVLTELGLPFESVKVDTKAGFAEDGEDFRLVNPKGYVPALRLDADTVLTENAAILQYLADKQPGAGLAPAAGTLERTRLQEWLSFISSELHTAFGPFFAGAAEGAARESALAKLRRKIGNVEQALADGRAHLLGGDFTVADAYLFVVLNWANFIGVDLSEWPSISAFMNRVGNRPAVRSALIAEGLLAAEPA